MSILIVCKMNNGIICFDVVLYQETPPSMTALMTRVKQILTLFLHATAALSVTKIR
jgi:hypothetical protein